MRDHNRTQDIIVTIAHPHGDIQVTLAEWIRRGPGVRDLLAPVSAKHRITGERLSLRAIPLVYRNNTLSRALIKLGILKNPWPNKNGSDQGPR